MCLGGTFWPLHAGHDHLLSFALERADSLIIGLTSDRFASVSRQRMVAPYDIRKRLLSSRLASLSAGQWGDTGGTGGTGQAGDTGQADCTIVPLNDFLDTSGAMDDVQAIVLSADMQTGGTGERVNALRLKAGQKPLEVLVAPELPAMDGLPVRATRVARGELHRDGRVRGVLRVAVGTANPTKVEAARLALSELFPGNTLDVRGLEVSSGVPDQPSGRDVPRGAVARARAAMESAFGGGGGADSGRAGADESAGPSQGRAGDMSSERAGASAHLAVGIEAGLFRGDGELPTMDVQYCAVTDRGGRTTMGHGPGFVYPDELLSEVRGGKEVRQVMLERYWKDGSHRGLGAVHTFSRGAMDRMTLTRLAVLMAMIPRISGRHGF